MKLKTIFVILSFTLFLVGCGFNKDRPKTESKSSSSSTVKPLSPNKETKETDKGNLSLAEEFMTTYIEQSFDLLKLKSKEDKLRAYAGDTSLDKTIQSLGYLQNEVAEYQKTKKVVSSASVTLVERELTNVTAYQNGALFFVDVSYKEKSPAYAGVFDRRQQFTFKMENNKILQFEEVLNK